MKQYLVILLLFSSTVCRSTKNGVNVMKSNFGDFDVKNKTVLLRIDANVPIDHGIILNDQRLIASLPTINLLLDKGANIILLSHLGRPKSQEPELSTQQLVSWFDDNGLDVQFAKTVEEAQQKKGAKKRIILLENLRFFPGEKGKDPAFAQQLANLGDFYVNDAFGAFARDDTSLTLLPDRFDSSHKTIGLLVEHELAMLDKIISRAKKPSYLIIGGGKVKSKIPLIQQLLPKLSSVFLGPAIVFTFLKAQGKKVGNSLVDNDALNLCKDIMMQAEQMGISIEYPVDYIIAEGSFEGPMELSDSAEIPEGYAGVSIGPKTALKWGEMIMKADTIIANGLMGTLKRIESLVYVKDMFSALAQTEATTIIAGGDSVAALYYFNLARGINYLSTGGSATLKFLGNTCLPPLNRLKDGAETK